MTNENEKILRGIGHMRPALSRREFLVRAGAGFGSLALTFLLAQQAEADAKAGGAKPRAGTGAGPYNPLAPKQPMLPARAKSVIFLFMYGGPSQVDTFDPKPELTKHDGLPLKGKGEIKTFFGNPGNLMKSPFAFRKYGQSGIEVSELFPSLAQHVD